MDPGVLHSDAKRALPRGWRAGWAEDWSVVDVRIPAVLQVRRAAPVPRRSRQIRRLQWSAHLEPMARSIPACRVVHLVSEFEDRNYLAGFQRKFLSDASRDPRAQGAGLCDGFHLARVGSGFRQLAWVWLQPTRRGADRRHVVHSLG